MWRVRERAAEAVSAGLGVACGVFLGFVLCHGAL